MSIWQFNETLARRLFAWNIVNIMLGSTLSLRSGWWRGFGSQAVGWGVINMGIAVIGSMITRRRFTQQTQPNASAIIDREAGNLRRILWINSGLDVLYMIGGWGLAATRGQKDKFWQGAGHGIILQGFLLLVFDVIHALVVPDNSK